MHGPRRRCAAAWTRFSADNSMGWGMSRHWRGWLVALAWLVPSAAAAQTLPGWEIGAEGYYYAYREPNLMHQTGPTAGVNASYTYKVGTAFLTANGIADVG